MDVVKLRCVIELYEEFHEVANYWPHGNPNFRSGDENDVVIFFKVGHEVDENATPESLGIKCEDGITIYHRVEVLLHMPDHKL